MEREPVVVTVEIAAGAEKVWRALTDPAMIKQYLFGTETVTDWVVGHPLRFRGEYQGKRYEDKGTILANEPGRKLSYSYWSSMGGVPDTPEHYRVVAFELAPAGTGTRLTLTQSVIVSDTADTLAHTASNWTMVLQGLSKLVEG